MHFGEAVREVFREGVTRRRETQSLRASGADHWACTECLFSTTQENILGDLCPNCRTGSLEPVREANKNA